MRYRLVSDESGHDYVILIDDENEFYKWSNATENGEDFDGKDFNDSRINNSGWTFADPQGWE